jgi:hypothetical protein
LVINTEEVKEKTMGLMAVVMRLDALVLPQWLMVTLWINVAISALCTILLILLASSVDITTFLDGGAQTVQEDDISAQSEEGEGVAWLHVVLMALVGAPSLVLMWIQFSLFKKRAKKRQVQ